MKYPPRHHESAETSYLAMAYSATPDSIPSSLDPEGGGAGSGPASKDAGYRSKPDYRDRSQERGSARDLDRIVEGSGLTRARKDLERAFPRSAIASVNDRKRRTLPIPDAIRLPPSARQRKARSVAKRSAQSRLPTVGYKAMHTLISTPDAWADIGAELTKVRGDAHMLDDKTRTHVQRVDRSIQTAERLNDRGHVVYCAVTVPDPLPDGQQHLPAELQPGARIEFDRFTMATHAIHELDPILGQTEIVFEMQTARGMYLGASGSADDTAHLLPRGMQWDVVSAYEGRYRRPDGSLGRRRIVQLLDCTEGE